MSKVDEILARLRLRDEESKKWNPIVVLLAVIGALTVIGLVAYFVFKKLQPQVEDEFSDDFDDDFDDYFEDEEAAEESGAASAVKETAAKAAEKVKETAAKAADKVKDIVENVKDRVTE